MGKLVRANVDRRSFVGGMSALLALVAAGCKPRAESMLRSENGADQPNASGGRRISVSTTEASDKETVNQYLAVYALAVRLMLVNEKGVNGALNLGVDKWNAPVKKTSIWGSLATIHENFCPHGNWFFLPWHRAYVLAFENLCRDIVLKAHSQDPAFLAANGVSPDAAKDFALPYWDWSSANSGTLPDAFLAANSSLAWKARGMTKQKIGRSICDAPEIQKILATDDFFSFASGPAKGIRASSAQGLLESVPHNNIHMWIGGDMGDMRSPQDPIFWFHHCNVDRLWAEWSAARVAKGEDAALPPKTSKSRFGTFTSDEWLNASLGDFWDLSGKPVKSKVADVQKTTVLGYTYDTLPGGRGPAGGGKPGVPEPRERPPETGVIALAAIDLVISANDVQVTLPVTEAMKNIYDHIVNKNGGVRLHIRNIIPNPAIPKDTTLAFDWIFHNGKSVPISTVAFFGMDHAGHDGHGGDTGMNFVLDLSQIVRENRDVIDNAFKTGVTKTLIRARISQMSSPAQPVDNNQPVLRDHPARKATFELEEITEH